MKNLNRRVTRLEEIQITSGAEMKDRIGLDGLRIVLAGWIGGEIGAGAMILATFF